MLLLKPPVLILVCITPIENVMVIAEPKMTAVCRNMFSKLTTIVIFPKIVNSTDLKISASSGNLKWVAVDLHYGLDGSSPIVND